MRQTCICSRCGRVESTRGGQEASRHFLFFLIPSLVPQLCRKCSDSLAVWYQTGRYESHDGIGQALASTVIATSIDMTLD